MKESSGANRPGHHPLAAALSGAVATTAHDSILTPWDTIKQRMQLGSHTSVKQCLQTVVAKEGPRALYISLPTTLLMNIPYAGVMVAANESLKEVLGDRGFQPGFGMFLISGAGAGGMAAAITTPLDVVKTRLQTQDVLTGDLKSSNNIVRYKGAFDTVRRILAEEGAKAFFKGLKPRLALHMPAAAISWTTYEMMKTLLSNTFPSH